jgi:hypothetical protein
MFIREFDKGASGLNSVIAMAGTEKLVAFGAFPARIGTFEAWSETIGSSGIKTLLSVTRMEMGEGALTPDGEVHQRVFNIDTSGLEAAWTQLFASCPAAPTNIRPVVVAPVPASAPTQ